eukprot:6257005-Ditylum_brightwellii.AAC.1
MASPPLLSVVYHLCKDLASQSEVGQILGGHNRMVTGLAMDLEGRNFCVCSNDGYVKLLNLGNGTFKSIDHHWTK